MDWTDERMDDLASRMDAGFLRTDHDIRDLRSEIAALREETHDGFAAVRKEMSDQFGQLHGMMLRGMIALIVGLLGVLAALVGVVATLALGS